MYEPLKTKVKEFASRIDNFNNSFKSHSKKLISAKEKLINGDLTYLDNSRSLEEALKKIQFNAKERDIDFFNDKLFSSLNYRMKATDKQAKELKEATDNLNRQISEYKSFVKEGVKDLEAMENERMQVLIDSLNQINVFQTNCEMNDKYDANNFNETVENIKTDDCISAHKNLCNEVDLTKLDSYNFQPYDELLSKDDYEMNDIDPETEKDCYNKIKAFVDDLNSDIETFNELMLVKLNRYCFMSILNKFENPCLKDEKQYNHISKLIMAFLKG